MSKTDELFRSQVSSPLPGVVNGPRPLREGERVSDKTNVKLGIWKGCLVVVVETTMGDGHSN